MKITIIGLGYVGLVTGACLAKLGHQVAGYDIDKKKIGKLRRGEAPFFEIGMQEMLSSIGPVLQFAESLQQALKNTEVIFICVGTPPKRDGSVDMRAYWSALKDIARFLNKEQYLIIVNKSTVPVGTARQAQKFFQDKKLDNIKVAANPEFLREGTAIFDFLHPDRIIIGAESRKAGLKLKELFKKIKCSKLICDLESAELVKYASNAFLATKISFINEIASVCERVGADVENVAQGVGLDSRIGSKFLKAGIGYGGSCFPKDIKALNQIAGFHRYNFRLLKAVIEVNNQQRELVFQKIKNELAFLKNKKIGVLGLAFKDNTDDIRESASLAVIKRLLRAGAKVTAYDPEAMGNSRKFFATSSQKPRLKQNAYEAVEKVDLILIATEWPEFIKLNWERISSVVKNKIIVDGKNLLNKRKMEKLGFKYVGVGK